MDTFYKTISELAARWRVSYKTAYLRAKSPDFPPKRRLGWHEDDIREWENQVVEDK